MLLHIGEQTLVRAESVIGFFDLDGEVTPEDTRAFLRRAERDGVVELLTEDVPRAAVLTSDSPAAERVYLTRVSSATLSERAGRGDAGDAAFLKESLAKNFIQK